MMNWNNVRAEAVHIAVAELFDMSNIKGWSPSEFYIACKMITWFLEKQYGCVWLDEEKFLSELKEFKAE